ncbi:MAG: hypothetical protein ACTSP4_17500 [Candidatus Hodarchaeales archaeon]
MMNRKLLAITIIAFSLLSFVFSVQGLAPSGTEFHLCRPDGTTDNKLVSGHDPGDAVVVGVPSNDWINFTTDTISSATYTPSEYNHFLTFRNTSNDQYVNVLLLHLDSGGEETVCGNWTEKIIHGTFESYYNDSTPFDVSIGPGDRFRVCIKVPGPSSVILAYNSSSYTSSVFIPYLSVTIPEFEPVLALGMVFGIIVVVNIFITVKKKRK